MNVRYLSIAAVFALLFTSAFATVPDIYPPPGQAQADIDAGIARAAAQHKRVILDFGGNWCTDCHVLDYYFHDGTNLPLLDANFVLVHVNIGHMLDNLALVQRYGIPTMTARGEFRVTAVPALAVLDEHGKLLYTQKSGEFESMRRMQTASVTEFLQRWKAGS
jgi:thioredoxin-related protein